MDEAEHFYQHYSTFDDIRILDILKNRDNYQELAFKEAIRIAIERGLIFSEQDLMASEYQVQTKNKFSPFPIMTDRFQREKLTHSVSRIIYMVTLIPLINATLDYSKGDSNITINLSIALIWVILSFLNDKFRRNIYFYLQFFYALAVGFWYALQLFNVREINYIDLIILFVGLLIIIYFLILLRKLRQIPA